MMTRIDGHITETDDPRDSPVIIATYPDGSMQVTRGDEPDPGWRNKIHLAHGTVSHDGVLSELDRANRIDWIRVTSWEEYHELGRSGYQFRWLTDDNVWRRENYRPDWAREAAATHPFTYFHPHEAAML